MWLLLVLLVPLRAEAGPPFGWFSAVTSKDPGPCADAAIRVRLGFGMTVKENAQFTKMTLVSAENREVNLVVICSPKEGGSRITVVVASARRPRGPVNTPGPSSTGPADVMSGPIPTQLGATAPIPRA